VHLCVRAKIKDNSHVMRKNEVKIIIIVSYFSVFAKCKILKHEDRESVWTSATIQPITEMIIE